MLNTPVFFTSFVAMAARLSMSFEHCVFFNSHSVARASAMAPFVIAFAPAFIAFMGAMAIAENTLGTRGSLPRELQQRGDALN